ncbi:hypothetical protein Hte_005998 [Hypoxylon texense]
MKASFAFSLAFLSVVSAFEIADIYKPNIGKVDWDDLYLEDKYVLHATWSGHEYTLDLNNCFANYEGSLTHILDGNGNFGQSCPSCAMNGTVLTCECSKGEGLGNQHNEFQLDDFKTLQFSDSEFTCTDMYGMEKRDDNKGARLFVA